MIWTPDASKSRPLTRAECYAIAGALLALWVGAGLAVWGAGL